MDSKLQNHVGSVINNFTNTVTLDKPQATVEADIILLPFAVPYTLSFH